VLIVGFNVEPITIKDVEVDGHNDEKEWGQDQEIRKGDLDVSKRHFNHGVCDEKRAVRSAQDDQQAKQRKTKEGKHG
jgi:hypothetical protein